MQEARAERADKMQQLNCVISAILALCLCFHTSGSFAENILFYLGFGSYSHQIALWPLADSLARRGHSVTILSPFEAKEPSPNINEFHPAEFTRWSLQLELEEAPTIFESRKQGKSILDWLGFYDLALDTCEKLLDDQEFAVWLNGAKFDLVVIDILYNECGLAFAYKFNAPTIYYSTSSLYPWITEQFGLETHSTGIPDMLFSAAAAELGFKQRVYAALHPLVWHFYKEWIYFPKLEGLIRARLPELSGMPTVAEMERNVSLLLLNTHFSEEYARSLPPFVVSVGGTHCFEDVAGSGREIATDLEDFIHLGRDGFIFVSFGSYADISDNPQLLKVFIKAFGKFPNLQFIWKSRGQLTAGLPSNVMMAKWFPQKQLLGDKRLRAFLTHGGALSIQEAICAGIPLIAMPVFAEQDYNAHRIQAKGCGLTLEITTLTEEELISSISALLENPMYEQNMKMLSKLFRDRPESPIVTATWWTEYVLRHRNRTAFLKPWSMNQTWFQKRLLDVWAICFGFLAVLTWMLVVVVRKLFQLALRVLSMLFLLLKHDKNGQSSTRSLAGRDKLKSQ